MKLLRKNPFARSVCSGSSISFTGLFSAVAMLAFGLSATANAQVTLTLADPGGSSSFATAGRWSDAAAPSAGKTYSTGALTLRTPNTSETLIFGGDTLTIPTGGRLLGKPSGPQTISFPNGDGLILAGGQFDVANTVNDAHVLTVTGKITVTADSNIGAFSQGANNVANFETLDLQAEVWGTSNLSIGGGINGGNNSGVVRFSNPNPFSGSVTVTKPNNNFIASQQNRLLQFGHADALQYANLSLSAPNDSLVSFAASANTAPFKIASLQGTSILMLQDTAGSPITLEIGATGLESSFSGSIRGTGSLVKKGDGAMLLNGTHTFSGNTTIEGGRIMVEKPTFDDGSTITIEEGAFLELFHDQTDVVSALIIDGVSLPDGYYDEISHGDYIGGLGRIRVYNGPPLPRDVILTASDLGNNMITSFNGPGNWDFPGAPVPANSYFVPNGLTLRTPALTASGDAGTFAGNSLTIQSGARFLGKAGASVANNEVIQTMTINNLILNGGVFCQAGASSTKAQLILSGNVNVTADSAVGAAGAFANNSQSFETLEFLAPISGAAKLTIAGGLNEPDRSGVVRFSAANPFTGTVEVVNTSNKFIASEFNRILQLNHRDAVANATVSLIVEVANGLSFTPTANTGPFRFGAISGTSAQRLHDTDGNPVTIEVGGNNASTTYSGALTGPGAVVKVGTGEWTLSGEHTYSGNTSVTAGTLTLQTATLDDLSTVSVAAGATLKLDHTGTDVVGALILGGAPQPAGTYHSGNSGGRITGTGSIQVTGEGGGEESFASYMDGFTGLTAAEKEADADPDGDGISNLLEYALDGLNPVSSNALPSISGGTITFNKRALAVANGDLTYTIETSTTLGSEPNAWTEVSATDTASSISYTLPTGEQRIFVRLRVVSR